MHRRAFVPFLLLGVMACGVDQASPNTYQQVPPDANVDASTETSTPDAPQPDANPDGVIADSPVETSEASDASNEADVHDASFVYDATAPDQDACAVTVVEARQASVAMYILLDRSGSMTFSNKWATVVDGLSQFVALPEASGMNLALQYFPLEIGHDCAGGAYTVPEVAMGQLPGHAAAIVASLESADPAGVTTPIEGALNGIAQYTHAYASSTPGSEQRVVGVLVTDGLPDEACANDTQQLATIAADSHGGTPSIPTYVIGMSGADFSVLSAIAAAGGTTSAYSVTSGGPDAFLLVLNEIRAAAVGCDFPVPVPEGGVVDFANVQLIYTPGTGNEQTLTHQPGSANCGSGWYFDDNTSPTTITLCPPTCQMMHQDAKARVDISLGCLGA
jgi:hypothetical protein